MQMALVGQSTRIRTSGQSGRYDQPVDALGPDSSRKCICYRPKRKGVVQYLSPALCPCHRDQEPAIADALEIRYACERSKGTGTAVRLHSNDALKHSRAREQLEGVEAPGAESVVRQIHSVQQRRASVPVGELCGAKHP